MQTHTSFGLQIRAHHTAASVLASRQAKGGNDLGMWGAVGSLELILVGGECRTTPEKLQKPRTFSIILSDFTYATQIQR